MARTETQPTWRLSDGLIDYPVAQHSMQAHVDAMIDQRAGELIWLLEHPPLYTAGTRAEACDLLSARFPVYDSERGGQYTYHGPGQRVAYVCMDLRAKRRDLRLYVHCLEQWVIDALARFGITGERRAGRVGIWVVKPDGGEAKIAAIGVRVKRWVTYHGIAINVAPDLEHFSGIVPCGIADAGVTSFADLNVAADLPALDAELRRCFASAFAPLQLEGDKAADCRASSDGLPLYRALV